MQRHAQWVGTGVTAALVAVAAGCGAPGAPVGLPDVPVGAAALGAPAGNSVAGAAAAYAAHMRFLGSGLAGPNGLAIDGAGNLYEADWNRGTVTKITPAGATSRYAGGFSGCAGLAFDAGGNMLVAAYNGNTLEKVPPGGGSHATFVQNGLKRPVWPAVDSQGRIYLADYSNNRIAAISSPGVATTFASLSAVNAIAMDPQDNLWVCTWGGKVLKITPSGQGTQVATGMPTACGIAWSPTYLAVVTYGAERNSSGRLLLVDFQGHNYEVATGLNRPSSVIFDKQGNIYTADIGDTALRVFSTGGPVQPPTPMPHVTANPTPTPLHPSPMPPVTPPPGMITYQTGTDTVTIGPGGVFTPSHVYVRPGAATRFVNIDSTPHTVTGFGGATSNSGPLQPGGVYTHNWKHPGTWTFPDTLTPNAPTFYLTDVPA